MPRYSVSCTIHEAILPQPRRGVQISPLVAVRCFGKEQTTTVKTGKTSIACWDETLYWDDIELSPQIWDVSVIDFELQSANSLWRNETLGTCSLQLKLISTGDKNAFSGRIALTAPNSVRVVGQLTVTVNAYDYSNCDTKGVTTTVSEELEPKKNSDFQVPTLTSPQVYRKAGLEQTLEDCRYYHLYVNIYSLEHIQIGIFGLSPYITCEYAGCRLKSSKPIKARFSTLSATGGRAAEAENLIEKVKNYCFSDSYGDDIHRSNFTFNECFLIPVKTTPGKSTLDDNVVVRIWMGLSLDIPLVSDLRTKGVLSDIQFCPKLIAEGIFSLAKLRAQRQPARWFNFYSVNESVPDDKSGFNLSSNPECTLVSEYVGRILMSASIRRINKVTDVLRAHVIPSKPLEDLFSSPTRIFCDVYSVESLSCFGFDQGFEILLEISSGPFVIRSDWHAVTMRAHILDDSLKILNIHPNKNEKNSRDEGWRLAFDSINGRLPPLDLLVAQFPEEQWLLFIKIIARELGGNNNKKQLLGYNKFTFENISDHTQSSPLIPFWITLFTPKSDKRSPKDSVVNVLLTLQRQCFYSQSLNSSYNYEFRMVSRNRRASMVKVHYELRCYVYAAVLAEFPEHGVLVSVNCDGNGAKTSVRRQKTRYPVFTECLSFPVSAMTSPVSGLASPTPILISLSYLDKRNRIKHSELSITHYNRLIISHTESGNLEAGRPKWLQMSSSSRVLLFTELVLKNESLKVPYCKMSPQITECTVSLGLLGFRNISLGDVAKVDGILFRISMQNYGISSSDEQSFTKYSKLSSLTNWSSGGYLNLDTFAVEDLKFKVPVDVVFDPHIELFCFFKFGETRNLFGYYSFQVHPAAVIDQQLEFQYDLRYNMSPKAMSRLLDDINRQKYKNNYNLDFSVVSGSDDKFRNLKDGIPEVIQRYTSCKAYRKIIRSLDLDYVGAYVPSKFVLAIDGKKIPRELDTNTIYNTSDVLDSFLKDVPYNIMEDSRSVSEGHRKSILKYFLTVFNEDAVVLNKSYIGDHQNIATNYKRMYSAFRRSLKGFVYKLRFHIVAINTFPLGDADNVNLNLVMEIGRSEFREYMSKGAAFSSKMINKMWKRDIFMPEDSLIHLKVVDSQEQLDGGIYDRILATGYIDLENRWFSKKWHGMLKKDTIPIERIHLKNLNNDIQGSLDVIIQLGRPEQIDILKPLTFEVPQPSPVEIRLIIWSTRGVKLIQTQNKDKSGPLDLYVVSTLDCQGYKGENPEEQKTDVHYNCNGGTGSFNWRVVYPQIHMPSGSCQLQLAIYDFWKVGSPIFIGEANLELRSYAEIVSTTANNIQVNGEIPICNAASMVPLGFIQVTLQVLTQTEASASPVGMGREEPNCKPHLTAPTSGRQWNDWLSHTPFYFDFSGLSLYVRGAVCLLMFLWLFIVAFVYPALLI